MVILGIETSCDETSCGVVRLEKGNLKLLSNVVSSSSYLHSKTGGIIPEIAAREQVRDIFPVIKKALSDCGLSFPSPSIDAIAVTVGPGLIGSLLVGVETAKTLSLLLNKPLIPVNHLLGHIYANFISQSSIVNGQLSNVPQFPAIGLIVSGGHTDLILMRGHGNIKRIGGTRDDAAGEAFDKIGRMLGLPYPSGPIIEKLARLASARQAKDGDPKRFIFPRPMMDSPNFDFSFSGLKTSVYRKVKDAKLSESDITNICAGVQEAIVDVLTSKTIKAAQKYNVKSILLGGGVAANQALTENFIRQLGGSNFKLGTKLFVPPKSLCTDNGAMIAACGFFNSKTVSFEKVDANPSLYF